LAWRELFEREIAPVGFLKAHITAEAAAAVFAGYPLRRRKRVLYGLGRPTRASHRPTDPGTESHPAGPHANPVPIDSGTDHRHVPTDSRTDSWPAGPQSSPLANIPRASRLPDGFRISRINDSLAGLANFTDVVAEIESCWPSMRDFRRSGFGFVACDTDAIVCWCTAEYVSPGQCGVGVETVTDYRNRGFATATATAFVEHCLTNGISPYWDAWADNHPSIAVARKVGFAQVETYEIYAG
jgi:GNAT superfamily N-acetyltransferase